MNYERIFYSIEDDCGTKVFHYITSMCESDWAPDGWTSEDYRAQDETSVEVTDYTWLYINVSELQDLGLIELYDRLDNEEGLSKQYMDRVIAYEADEIIEIENAKGCKELDIRKVNEDTPYGFYWSLGYWMMKE